MKITMKRLRVFFSVMILTVFGFFAFSQDALAKPDWIKTTYKWKFVKVGKDKQKPGYYAFQILMTHKNNSKTGDIVTCIRDKKMKIHYQVRESKFSSDKKFKKSNKVEIHPGQSVTLKLIVPIKDKPKNDEMSYWAYNDEIEDLIHGNNKKSTYLRVSYDFQVDTKRVIE